MKVKPSYTIMKWKYFRDSQVGVSKWIHVKSQSWITRWDNSKNTVHMGCSGEPLGEHTLTLRAAKRDLWERITWHGQKLHLQ